MSDIPADDTSETICQLCYPGTTTVGRPTASTVVGVTGDGTYQLFIEPAHRGDMLASFTTKPTPDPFGDDIDDDEDIDDATMASFDTWIADATAHLGDELTVKLGMRGTWHLVTEMIAVGYDPHNDGDAHLWLYDRIGKVIADPSVGVAVETAADVAALQAAERIFEHLEASATALEDTTPADLAQFCTWVAVRNEVIGQWRTDRAARTPVEWLDAATELADDIDADTFVHLSAVAAAWLSARDELTSNAAPGGHPVIH